MEEAATPAQSFWSGLVTPESVYGTILVGGMIVGAGAVDATPWHTFLAVLGTVLVFWTAHVYAGTVAGDEGPDATFVPSLRRSMHRSLGFLTSAVPPLLILLFGALEIVPDDVALWIALWLGVAILGVIGYSAFSLRGSSVPVRLLGCVSTAALGVAIIVLKAIIH